MIFDDLQWRSTTRKQYHGMMTRLSTQQSGLKRTRGVNRVLPGELWMWWCDGTLSEPRQRNLTTGLLGLLRATSGATATARCGHCATTWSVTVPRYSQTPEACAYHPTSQPCEYHLPLHNTRHAVQQSTRRFMFSAPIDDDAVLKRSKRCWENCYSITHANGHTCTRARDQC